MIQYLPTQQKNKNDHKKTNKQTDRQTNKNGDHNYSFGFERVHFTPFCEQQMKNLYINDQLQELIEETYVRSSTQEPKYWEWIKMVRSQYAEVGILALEIDSEAKASPAPGNKKNRSTSFLYQLPHKLKWQ